MGDGEPKPTEKVLLVEYLTLKFLPVSSRVQSAPESSQDSTLTKRRSALSHSFSSMPIPIWQRPPDSKTGQMGDRTNCVGYNAVQCSPVQCSPVHAVLSSAMLSRSMLSSAILQAIFLHFPDESHFISSLLISCQISGCYGSWDVCISALDQASSTNGNPSLHYALGVRARSAVRGLYYTSWEMSLSLRCLFSLSQNNPIGLGLVVTKNLN